MIEKMIDFCGKRKVFYTVSIILVALTLVATFVFGIQLDIQFKGGSIMTYSYTGDVDKNAVQQLISQTLNDNVSVQQATDFATGSTNLVVSLTADESLTLEAQSAVTDALQAQYPDNQLTLVKTNNVDPTIGKEFFQKCLLALFLAALLMVIYIAFRFRKIGGWSAGVMCVLALLHDSIVVYATFIVCRIPINENFIAVVITIIGYSLNATIVIYDRIRENQKLYGSSMALSALVNKSVNQSLGRAVMTSVSTIAAMAIVCVVGKIYNLDSILSFAFPLTMGMVSGLYSSVCIAPTLWTSWREYWSAQHQGKKKAKQG